VYKGDELVCVVAMMHDRDAGSDKTMYGVRARLRRAGFEL
jgi:hypothetical protein